MKRGWERGSCAGSAVMTLLSQLTDVRRTASGRWIAKCPSHDDKSPSLSICETPDGLVLIKDWGGCGTDAVLRTLGLNFSALFPERLPGGLHRTGRAPRIPAGDILACVSDEVLVAACAASDLAAGVVLSAKDHDRLCLAARRLNDANEVCNGRR